MSRILPFLILALFINAGLCTAPRLYAQDYDAAVHSEALRGEVWIELEPIQGMKVDEHYPLDIKTASTRALEEAAVYYSAMIYGWSFHYDIGERARQIDEKLELTPVNLIPFGDPGLKVTQVENQDLRVHLWTDYEMTDAQQRRLSTWRQGNKLSMQGVGYGPLGGPVEASDWMSIKMAALNDAARAALRAALRASERNRPKEVNGFISLAAFPRYFFSDGRWAASARFKVEISEIIPFAAY
ncbi:MAG: hypothetical protein FWF29_05470 [Treponema sp.]|nr:hypothetical protein [Treponema sp.]